MGIKEFLKKSKEELCAKNFWKALRAEFFGTMLYVIFGCSCAVSTKESSTFYFASVLSFGLSFATLSKCLGQISGGHFNPAITVALLCTRYTTVLKGLFYILAQISGSVCGAGILYGLIPKDYHNNLGISKVNVDNARAFGTEFLATFVVIFSYFSTLENKNNVLVPDPLICGLAVSLSQLFAVSIFFTNISFFRIFSNYYCIVVIKF